MNKVSFSQQHAQTAEFIAMFPRHSSERLKLAAARALQRRSTSTHAESLIITENVRCQKKKKKKALKKALNKHFQYSTFTHFFFFFCTEMHLWFVAITGKSVRQSSGEAQADGLQLFGRNNCSPPHTHTISSVVNAKSFVISCSVLSY